MVSAVLDGEFSLYRQVENILRDQILDGVLRVGDRLPAEEVLRAQFGVSRGTLRQALDGLERDGLIARSRGRGTFIDSAAGRIPHRARLSVDRMLADARRASRLLRSGSAVPPAGTAQALGLPEGREAPFFIRLSAAGRGFRIGLKRYLHPRFTADLASLAEADEFEALLAAGGVLRRGDVWAEAILAEPRFAIQLKVPPGTALLSLWWIDLVDGKRAACSQMLRPGNSAALMIPQA